MDEDTAPLTVKVGGEDIGTYSGEPVYNIVVEFCSINLP